MHRRNTDVVVLGVVLLLCSRASAQVDEWNLVKLKTGEQVADNAAPSEPFNYEVFSELFVNSPNGFTSVTLNGPGVSKALSGFNEGRDWDFFESFGSASAMDAAYPAGSYTLDTTGPLGAFSETIELTPTAFPAQPFFVDDVYSMLQGADAGQAITFNWNTLTADDWFFTIEETDGPSVFHRNTRDGTPPSTTSLTVPADTLRPGASYEVYLTFGNITEDPRDGFATGSSFAAPGFGSETFIAFTTASLVPEPASIGALATVLGGLLARGRRPRR